MRVVRNWSGSGFLYQDTKTVLFVFGKRDQSIRFKYQKLFGFINKGKGTVQPKTGHEGPEGEWRYSSTFSLTSALDGVGGQRHAPCALHPGKRPGTQCVGGWVDLMADQLGCGKSRPPQGFDPRTIQS
jgi:hypothetical protein